MSCNGKDLTRKFLWGKCIRKCEKNTFFRFDLNSSEWYLFEYVFRCVVDWNRVLCQNERMSYDFVLFIFFIQNILCRPMSAKLQIALKNWIRVVRPPERFYFAISHTRYRIHLSTFYMHFQQKKYISYHFGNGFKTHDYNSRNPNKNEAYERKMTGSTRILKGTRPYWIIVIMFLRDVSKYVSIEFVLALQLWKRWSRLYQIISIYI